MLIPQYFLFNHSTIQHNSTIFKILSFFISFSSNIQPVISYLLMILIFTINSCMDHHIYLLIRLCIPYSGQQRLKAYYILYFKLVHFNYPQFCATISNTLLITPTSFISACLSYIITLQLSQRVSKICCF